MNFIEAMTKHGWAKVEKSEKLEAAPYSSTWRKGPVRVELSPDSLGMHKSRVNYYNTCGQNIWTIAAIVVDQESRGGSFATDAIKDLIAMATELGAKEIHLEATPMSRKFKPTMDRPQLVVWYKRLGFVDQDQGEGIILELQIKQPVTA